MQGCVFARGLQTPARVKDAFPAPCSEAIACTSCFHARQLPFNQKKVQQLQQRGFVHPQKMGDARCRDGGSPTRGPSNLILPARGIYIYFFVFASEDPDLHPSRKAPTGYLGEQTACTHAQPLNERPPPSRPALRIKPSWPHPAPPRCQSHRHPLLNANPKQKPAPAKN